MSDKKVDLKQASAALAKMANVAKAFEDIHIVLEFMLNKKQVETELDSAIARKRKERDDLEKEADALRATKAKLTSQANKIMRDAVEESQTMRKAAKIFVTKREYEAHKLAGEALEKAEAEKARVKKFQRQINEKQKKLDEIEKKLDAAHKAAREILG